MIFKVYFLIIVLFLSVNLGAQTPEQRYFEWTEMPFSTEELAQRRTKLIEKLQADGKTGLIVIPARDGFSGWRNFPSIKQFLLFHRLRTTE